MRLVAYGEKLRPGGWLESFVVTEELDDYVELQRYLRRKFAGKHNRPSERELGRVISEVAALVGRFHAAGYNHRDLYCNHLFVKEQSPGEREIRLIDLQRVQRRRRFRRRWIVKDLAQLAWSGRGRA